ncbi:hypothetical protein [Pleomorphomonas koreensis]|uniref:hypothetical protein n=1 Tax=Pleomorphomonas koreensis TaxID=257440 RepID=UPI00041DB156|nr:hypothetical protein [Pleomorphomonas koreensis]
MSVNVKFAQGYPDPSTFKQPLAIYRGNPMRVINGSVQLAAGDDAGSVVFLGKIASSAILLPIGLMTHEAIAGLTSGSLGFGSAPGANAANALINAQTFAVAATKNPLLSVAIADLVKRVWQLAGYATDPARELDIVFTCNTAVTGGGFLHFVLPFVDLR